MSLPLKQGDLAYRWDNVDVIYAGTVTYPDEKEIPVFVRKCIICLEKRAFGNRKVTIEEAQQHRKLGCVSISKTVVLSSNRYEFART